MYSKRQTSMPEGARTMKCAFKRQRDKCANKVVKRAQKMQAGTTLASCGLKNPRQCVQYEEKK